jgi:hypothetical protein
MRDERLAWERAKGESQKAYSGFARYRDAGATRSVSKVAQELAKSRSLCSRWASRWGWSERAAMFDDDLDKQARARFAEEVLAAKARHQRTIQAAMSVVVGPIRMMLDTLQDGAVLQRETQAARTSSAGFAALFDRMIRSVQVLPAVIASERLVLGLSTAALDVEPKDSFRDKYAALVAADPIACDLAIQLLDRVAGTGPGTEPEKK